MMLTIFTRTASTVSRATVALAVILASICNSAQAAEQHYTLDPEHTTVAFLIKHVGYANTLGLFTDVAGGFSFDDETDVVSDMQITVSTASVNTANEARDKHVVSKDFLNVGAYPEMTFSAASATINNEGAGQIDGMLTLLGSTQPLVLDVQLNKAEDYPFGHKRFTLGVSATGSLERSEYGMDYGVANALVGNTVTLIIETEAIQDK